MTVETKFKRKLYGVVTSDTNDKTIVVNVVRRFKHRTYNKFVSQSKKYHAHDEKNKFKIGDTVRIEESKSYSKNKQFKVLEES